MTKLEGKVAVITGGNSGIGLATAQRFVAVPYGIDVAAGEWLQQLCIGWYRRSIKDEYET